MILYVGIEEKDAPHFEFRPSPSGDVVLPDDITNNYKALLDAVAASIRGRNADEDLTNGYSLMADPQGRELQQGFIPLLARDLALVLIAGMLLLELSRARDSEAERERWPAARQAGA